MYIISIGNDVIFLVQFETSKHEKIFLKNNKIARALRARAICGNWKNKQVLVYSKLHEKNHVITYTNNIHEKIRDSLS